jgi:hypothetical protein
MPSAIPPESEIAAFAEAAGYVDAQGRYTAPRPVLAAGAVEWAAEKARAAEAAEVSTARRLIAFYKDMTAELVTLGYAEGTAESNARDIMKSLAPALVRREGLKLSGDPHP